MGRTPSHSRCNCPCGSNCKSPKFHCKYFSSCNDRQFSCIQLIVSLKILENVRRSNTRSFSGNIKRFWSKLWIKGRKKRINMTSFIDGIIMPSLHGPTLSHPRTRKYLTGIIYLMCKVAESTKRLPISHWPVQT